MIVDRCPWYIAGPLLGLFIVFGAGWSLAGACPGPLAAMIGQGSLGRLLVAVGIVAGLSLQGIAARSRNVKGTPAAPSSAAGL